MTKIESLRPTIVLFGLLFAFAVNDYGQERGQIESRLSIKTSLPPRADVTHARTLELTDLIGLPDPPGVAKNDERYQKARIPAFANTLNVKEGDVIKLSGWLHVVRLMGDGDYNLRFSQSPDSADHYIIAEIPDEDDVAPQLRPMVKTAREFLKSKILGGNAPSRQGNTISSPSYVQITGQLFFNDGNVGNVPRPDAQGLLRASSWEVHPGLGLAISPKPK
jgi:hypothetical protein